MRYLFTLPFEMISACWSHRELINEFSKREILTRYRGSLLGLMWSFFNPLLMLSVYTFVFSEIFNSRWEKVGETKIEFALLLFIGLIIFNLFAECITRAPVLILANTNFVKKVIFPLEILPVAGMIAALFHGLISLIVWLIAYILFVGAPHITVLYIPLLIIPYIFFILGLSWFLSSLGVFLHDVTQFIGVLVHILLFLSPVFYPIKVIPDHYQILLFLNPLTIIIEQARLILYWGFAPDFLSITLFFIFSLIVSCLGFVWFQKTRKGFSDVL